MFALHQLTQVKCTDVCYKFYIKMFIFMQYCFHHHLLPSSSAVIWRYLWIYTSLITGELNMHYSVLWNIWKIQYMKYTEFIFRRNFIRVDARIKEVSSGQDVKDKEGMVKVHGGNHWNKHKLGTRFAVKKKTPDCERFGSPEWKKEKKKNSGKTNM